MLERRVKPVIAPAVGASKRLIVALTVNKMVGERPFDAIRVDEICQTVGISRSTFYRLFEDKYSIPTWCQDLALRAGIAEIGRTFTVQQGNIITLDGISLFRNLICSAGRNQGENTFRSLLIKKHAAAMHETLEDYKHVDIDDELEFQIGFTAESQANAVYRWLDGAYHGDAAHLTQMMISCFPPRLFNIINEPVNPKEPSALTYTSFLEEAAKLR